MERLLQQVVVQNWTASVAMTISILPFKACLSKAIAPRWRLEVRTVLVVPLVIRRALAAIVPYRYMQIRVLSYVNRLH